MKANKKTVKPWTAKEKDDLGTANRVMPVNWNWLPFGFTLIFFCPVPHRVESKWNGFDRQNEIGGWEQCVNRAAICSGVCVCVCVCVTCVYPVSYLYRTACRRVCSEKKKKWRSGRISEYPPGFDGNKKNQLGDWNHLAANQWHANEMQMAHRAHRILIADEIGSLIDCTSPIAWRSIWFPHQLSVSFQLHFSFGFSLFSYLFSLGY